MASAIDRRDMERIAKSVKCERAGERYGVPAIHQAAAETPFAFGKLVEMDSRGVLIEPRCNLMFGFLNGHAIDVVYFFADLVVTETMRASGQHGVISRRVDMRAASAKLRRLHAFR